MPADGDAELQIYAVDDYSFHAKDNYELVCFSTLPLRFGDNTVDATVPEGNNALYLSGCTDRGLRLELKEVVAWRLELDGEQPEFFVLPPANAEVGCASGRPGSSTSA